MTIHTSDGESYKNLTEYHLAGLQHHHKATPEYPSMHQLDMVLNSPYHDSNVKRMKKAGYTTDDTITWYPPKEDNEQSDSR